MKKLKFNNKSYLCEPNKSVLQVLLDQGNSINWSCKSGFCHSCIMKACDFTPPNTTQQGFTEAQIEAKLFAACQLIPQQDISVALYRREYLISKASIINKQQITYNKYLISLNTYHPITLKQIEAIAIRKLRYSEEAIYNLSALLNENTCNNIATDHINIVIEKVAKHSVNHWLFYDAIEGNSCFFRVIITEINK